MNKLITLLGISCFMVACSGSSGSGGGGGGTPGGSVFEKATAGTWVSDCTQTQMGFVRELLNLEAGGKGSLTFLGFATAECSGQANPLQTTNFTYKVTATKGDTSDLTLKIENQPEQKVSVRVNGNSMSVTSEQGTKNYQRGQEAGGNAPGGNPAAPGGAMAAFDAAAKGTWITENCYELNQGGTAMIVLEITGGGKAIQMLKTYGSADCSGQSQPGNRTAITYTVDQFANGQGQLTLNGQAKVSIQIQGNRMSVQDQNGTYQYTKTP